MVATSTASCAISSGVAAPMMNAAEVPDEETKHSTSNSVGDTVSFTPHGALLDGNNAAAVVSDTVSFLPPHDATTIHNDHHHTYFTPGHSEPHQLIDNSRINYVPIKLRCGVTAMCRTNVLILCRQILSCLHRDITQCLQILPPSVHAFIKRTRIWINLSYIAGRRDNPRLLTHTTAHHSDWWLLRDRDRPDKMHGIEIYDCWEYLRMRQHWNGAGLILHELTHLIHQFALPHGLANPQVVQAYCRARQSGRYDKALRRDWAGTECETDMAYAMVNEKEFWAELSVTYLCDAYHHLDKVNDQTRGVGACSPPLMDPDVLERVQQRQREVRCNAKGGIPQRQLSQQSATDKDHEQPKSATPSLWERFLRFLRECCNPKAKRLRQQQQQPPCAPHCNKFYPFTRGQLREHDLETYRVMQDLWCQVAQWDDPLDDRICRPGGFGMARSRGGGGDVFAPLIAPQQPATIHPESQWL